MRDCLTGIRSSFPGARSSGVAIVRALATNPDLLLMDEPFSSLDALTREHLQDTLAQMWQKKGLTFVIVTHSVEEAVFLGRHILVLTDRPAKIADLVENPAAGDKTGRAGAGFYQMVRRVRAVMGI